MAITRDTIAAIATGSGRAGIGIVRISGSDAPAIAETLCGRALQDRHAHYLDFLDADGVAIDRGIAILFRAPHSYTGEDVLELQGHGGPVVLDLLLAAALSAGARPARAGEFTERAWLNDRIDLAQAEAIADLIDSGSQAAARAAVRSMNGELSRAVQTLLDQLIALRVWLEAALDFSEEEIDFLADPELDRRAEALVDGFERLLARSRQGQRLRDGLTVVIAGEPNAGKSSLLNALAQSDTAIVTDIAGTTRDVLREDITLEGIPFHVVDTAGLRDAADAIEQEGIRRAQQAMHSADHLLLVVDATRPWPGHLALPEAIPCTVLINKIDRVDGRLPPALLECMAASDLAPQAHMALSVTRGDGMDAVRAHLLALAGNDSSVENALIARRRHLDALERARAHARDALARLREGQLPELAAEELRLAQQRLGEITGRFDADDLLGEIFSSFCIGK